ncbi:MAG: hypothetical protein HY020_21245 [Burkholderiales bacterium]|nr:hypothetical protein [Burkholderiales bacterium]
MKIELFLGNGSVGVAGEIEALVRSPDPLEAAAGLLFHAAIGDMRRYGQIFGSPVRVSLISGLVLTPPATLYLIEESGNCALYGTACLSPAGRAIEVRVLHAAVGRTGSTATYQECSRRHSLM